MAQKWHNNDNFSRQHSKVSALSRQLISPLWQRLVPVTTSKGRDHSMLHRLSSWRWLSPPTADADRNNKVQTRPDWMEETYCPLCLTLRCDAAGVKSKLSWNPSVVLQFFCLHNRMRFSAYTVTFSGLNMWIVSKRIRGLECHRKIFPNIITASGKYELAHW